MLERGIFTSSKVGRWTKIKQKRIKWGRAPQGARLNQVTHASETGKPSPREVENLKIWTRFFPDKKVLSKEIRQNHRRAVKPPVSWSH